MQAFLGELVFQRDEILVPLKTPALEAYTGARLTTEGFVIKCTTLLTLSLPECLMEFCKVTLTFESVDEIL